MPATEGLPQASYQDLRQVGVSPRQIDYWTLNGYLIAIDPVPGTGYARSWPTGELEVARKILAFLRAGLTLPAAEHAARNDGVLPGGAWQIKETTA
jgi:hypothetical protein